MKLLRGALFLVLIPAIALAGDASTKVTSVINGKSLVLASGDVVRLASIEAPNVEEQGTPGHPGRPGEPLGPEAKQALESLVLGKSIRIEQTNGKRDRYNRLLGQVYTKEGLWIQGEMLKRGYAMVYSFSDDAPDIITKMLAAERVARAAHLGIWAHPYYRIVSPAETNEFINRFKIVEGTIVSVNMSHDNMYINFTERWKGQFAVYIPRKFTPAFATLNVPSLVGKKIRVRGWIHYHNAPMIDIDHPEQIEVE